MFSVLEGSILCLSRLLLFALVAASIDRSYALSRLMEEGVWCQHRGMYFRLFGCPYAASLCCWNDET